MKRYLLDTHIWLWMLADPKRLGTQMRTVIDDAASTLLLSAASSWEISIKYRLGKLSLPDSPEVFVPDRMRQTATTPLAIEYAHTLHVASLPDLHRDPFDRLLVAQAQILNIPIITADSKVSAYNVTAVTD